ncbi:MAG: DUF72 domain-containing protein [Thermoplasmata archaeon]
MNKERIVIGCCGLPVALEKYAGMLNAVETQQTFYQLIPEKTAQTWREKADKVKSGFEFTVKAHQFITHNPNGSTYLRAGIKIPEEKKQNYGFFKQTEEVFSAWEHTVKIATILRAKAILIQSPPQFSEKPDNVTNLKSFFERAKDSNFLLFWEPRGKWKDETVKEICAQYGVYQCVDPTRRRPVTEKFFYFRLHGGARYRGSYNQHELADLASMLMALDGELAFVFFNNEYMLADAQKFVKIIEEI